MDIDEFITKEKHTFLGKEKENLDLLRRAANWASKYWDDIASEEAQMNNPCMQKFKQTHQFQSNIDIALYHN